MVRLLKVGGAILAQSACKGCTWQENESSALCLGKQILCKGDKHLSILHSQNLTRDFINTSMCINIITSLQSYKVICAATPGKYCLLTPHSHTNTVVSKVTQNRELC